VILGTIAQKGKSDKELVIIVTPHVITPEEAKKLQ
jgi:Flp pilus assembly secretin CpaC